MDLHGRIRRTESSELGPRGDVLFRRAWLPLEAPRCALLLVHGYAEHSGRYEHFGAWFGERGCAVHAYDHIGHGRSAGRRCHVTDFAELLDDLDHVLANVEKQQPGVPVFLVGHSMGGLVVAAHARERKPRVAGIVLSAAALSVAVPTWRIALARALRLVAPRLTMESGIDPQGLSRDAAVVEAYRADPLVERKMTLSLACELLDAARRTERGGADVALPALVLHGDADPICAVEGSRAFFAALAAPGSALRIYPGLRHEIFNEPEQEEVFTDVLHWTTERTP